MRIRINENASRNYIQRCYKGMPASCGRMHNPEWVETLKKVQGQWLEVEVGHLFKDQFNTVPVPGVSEWGLRIMMEDVVEIDGDIRDGLMKCNWCSGYDRDKDGACDKCGRSEYLELLK